MSNTPSNPGLRASTFLLAALSLSIGWGIRGNFGHEYGAMIPGALTGIAVGLMSGREDWRRRVMYFGMFGALGWGFGGSISYMQVISYTHSGHFASQLYGFLALFWIGFLWAGLGGAGTALPAVLDRERLTQLFTPLCWVFVLWIIFKYGEGPLVRWYERNVWYSEGAGYDGTWHRQKNPFYWFDTDWLQAVLAVTAIYLYDLWDRRKSLLSFPLCLGTAVVGALAGSTIQAVLDLTGKTSVLTDALVSYQGDTERFDTSQLLTNWPQFFTDITPHLGWILGVVIAVVIYFAIFGRFSNGSSLFLHMAIGWLAAFILMPVLLSNAFMEIGGFRMTPPRGDDWAGITGVLAGALVYAFRKGLYPLAYVAIVSGFVGGLGFAGATWFKLMMVAPGNPARLNPDRLSPSPTADIEAAWAHWQSANWHSFLEQSYGFVNGLGIALAMGLLVTRLPRLDDVEEQRRVRPWTKVFAAGFVLLLLTYVNLYKNVAVWTEQKARGYRPVPAEMTAPWFDSITLSASTWFNLTYGAIAVVTLALLVRHLREPIAIIPKSSLGKGQFLYLVFLWVMVIGNFERALVGFHQQRLLTEWVIVLNALIATYMILSIPREHDAVEVAPATSLLPAIARAAWIGVSVSALVLLAQFGSIRLVYGNNWAGHSGRDGKGQTRFGPDAEWRAAPILKNAEHR